MNKQAYIKGYLSKQAYDADAMYSGAGDEVESGTENFKPSKKITKATHNDGVTRKVDPVEDETGFIPSDVKNPESQMYRVSRKGLKGEDAVQM